MKYFLYTEDVSISKFLPSLEEAESWFEITKKEYEEKGYEVNPVTPEGHFLQTFVVDEEGCEAHFSAFKEIKNPDWKEEDMEIDDLMPRVAIP